MKTKSVLFCVHILAIWFSFICSITLNCFAGSSLQSNKSLAINNSCAIIQADTVVSIIANPDMGFTLQDTPIIIDVLANDGVLVQGVGFYIADLIHSDNAQVGMLSNQLIVYTPNPDFTGEDTFVYLLCDTATPQYCQSATVTVIVQTSSSPPLQVLYDINDSAPYTGNCVVTLYIFGGTPPYLLTGSVDQILLQGQTTFSFSWTRGAPFQITVIDNVGEILEFNALAWTIRMFNIPITLLDFSVIPKGSQHKLTWSTATETNNDHFSLYYSSDGNDFAPLARMAGTGNSSVTQHYQYEYIFPKSKTGTHYYQLRQTDFDGKEQIIATRTIRENSANTVRLYPQPAQDYVCIQPNKLDVNSLIQVQLYDALGRQVLSQVFGSADEKTIVLSLAHLTPAHYWGVIVQGEQRQNFSLLKE
jgi:hypothetical protein